MGTADGDPVEAAGLEPVAGRDRDVDGGGDALIEAEEAQTVPGLELAVRFGDSVAERAGGDHLSRRPGRPGDLDERVVTVAHPKPDARQGVRNGG